MLDRLLQVLPPDLRAAVDTSPFPPLDAGARAEVERLGAALGAYVVAYDLRAEAAVQGQLCATVEEAELDPRSLAALRDAERKLPPSLVLVAYARPVRPRQGCADRTVGGHCTEGRVTPALSDINRLT